jgi:hypothetical protein
MSQAYTRGWLFCYLMLAGCSGRADKNSTPPAGAPDSLGTVSSSEHPDSTPSEWRLVPGSSTGALTAETSEADLRQRHGAAMDTARISIGEGETMPGTVLYPDDSLRRVEIIWRDTVQHQRPARVILRGTQSKWQVNNGVSLGTSLQDLERLNGRPFTLAGFGWDYAGVVTDWKGGTLEKPLAGVKLYLDPGPAAYRSVDYSKVLGDRDYSSSLPPMQELNPRVAQIFVDFKGQ